MKRKILVVAAVIFHGTLQAQNETVDKDLDEITVTATRFPKKLSETGKVVNIIDRRELEQAGGKDLAQILNEQAGVIINGANSNFGKDKSVFLRGAANAYTVILINGVPVNDPTGVGGAYDLRMLPVEAIERIEILKGAQSTLYGTDAIAGVINIITKKGYGRKMNAYGGISYGRYNTFKGHAGLNGSFDKSSYNISFVHDETKGISEAKDTLGTQNFPLNGSLRNAVSVDIDGAITDKFHISPFFRYSYLKSSFALDAFTGGQNRYIAKLFSTGAQAQYNFNKGTVTGVFSYDDIERQYPGGYVEKYNGNKQTVELFNKMDWHKYFQTLLGVRYDDFTMKNPNPSTADTSVQVISPYLSLFLRDWHGFSLEAGGRLNNHSRYGNNFTFSLNPSYWITPNIKVFANYGTAFRAPALSELYGSFGANPGLKPEESQTLEGGIHYISNNRRIDIRGTAFSRNTKNIIVYQSTSNGYVNYNHQKDKGFEIEPTFRITDDIDLKVFYTFTEGKVTTATASGDTTYNNLFKRPKHTFGANIGYQVSPEFFISTGLQYFGKRNDLYFEQVPPYGQRVEPLEAYTLWNAYAEYGFFRNTLKTFVQVNNMLNADYYEVYGYSVLGRTVNAGIRFKL